MLANVMRVGGLRSPQSRIPVEFLSLDGCKEQEQVEADGIQLKHATRNDREPFETVQTRDFIDYIKGISIYCKL